MCSTNPSHTLTCVCHLLINSSTSHFPHVLLFSSLFATMVCVPPSPPLCVKFGYTALLLASENGHTATVELLLGAGADTDAKNEVRET
jgi:ankyrin repeat protein